MEQTEHAELGAVKTQAALLSKKLWQMTLIEFLLLHALDRATKGGVVDVVVIVVVVGGVVVVPGALVGDQCNRVGIFEAFDMPFGMTNTFDVQLRSDMFAAIDVCQLETCCASMYKHNSC